MEGRGRGGGGAGEGRGRGGGRGGVGVGCVEGRNTAVTKGPKLENGRLFGCAQ